MIEAISNWNTNILILVLAAIWAVVQVVRYGYLVWTQGKFEVGVAADFDKVFEGLRSLERDIEELKNNSSDGSY